MSMQMNKIHNDKDLQGLIDSQGKERIDRSACRGACDDENSNFFGISAALSIILQRVDG